MKFILTIVQIVLSVLLMAAVLLQSQSQGLGILGGTGEEFFKSRRGIEKILFRLTIILAIAFLVTLILQFLPA